MYSTDSNLVYIKDWEEKNLNQELEAAEVQLSQIRNFMSLSERQRQQALLTQEDPRESVRNLVRSTAKLYKLL